MMNNGRAAEQLTRKDCLFASINSLSLLDKRTIRSVLRINTVADVQAAVAELADKFSRYVENGHRERENGSLSRCDLCQREMADDVLYETADGEACKSCFEEVQQEAYEPAEAVA